MTYSDPMVTYIDPTYLLTSTYLTCPINRLILEIKRLPVGRKVATKFSVKHQGKDIHHPPPISINDLLVTFLGRPFALPFP